MFLDYASLKNDDERFMAEAIGEAAKAEESGDVPVGAVVVKDGKIIARAHNRIEKDSKSIAHAEMIALYEAEQALGSKWLNGCTMYVSLEPCSMCAGALVLSRIDRLVIGADDPKTGACGSLYNIASDERLNHRIEITRGILGEQCSSMLKEFFRERRTKTQVTEEE